MYYVTKVALSNWFLINRIKYSIFEKKNEKLKLIIRDTMWWVLLTKLVWFFIAETPLHCTEALAFIHFVWYMVSCTKPRKIIIRVPFFYFNKWNQLISSVLFFSSVPNDKTHYGNAQTNKKRNRCEQIMRKRLMFHFGFSCG